MQLARIVAVMLALVVVAGTSWVVTAGGIATDWSPLNRYTGWGSLVERAARLVPPVHRYFYKIPIFLCPTDHTGEGAKP